MSPLARFGFGFASILVLSRSGEAAPARVDPYKKAFWLGAYAAKAMEEGRYDEVTPNCRNAAEIYREIGARKEEAECLALIGLAQQKLEDFEAAQEVLQEAVEAAKAGGEPMVMASASFFLAQVLEQQEKLVDAVGPLEQALAVYRSEGNRIYIAGVLGKLGEIELKLGRLEKASAWFAEAMEIYQKDGRPEMLQPIIHNLATVLSQRGLDREALTLFQSGLELARRSKDRRGEAGALNGLGATYRSLGDHERALSSLRAAEKILISLKETGSLWTTRQNLAVLYVDQGRAAEALNLLQSGLSLPEVRANKSLALKMRNSMAALLRVQGHYEEARKLYEEVLADRRQSGDRIGEAVVLNNLANLEHAQGRQREALRLLEESLRIRQEAGDKYGEALTWINSGHLYTDFQQIEEALARFEKALEIARAIGDKTTAAHALLKKAQVLAAAGRSGLSAATEALNLFKSSQNRPGELNARKIRLFALSSDGESRQALSEAAEARALSQELGLRDEEAEILLLLGGLHLHNQEWSSAKAFLEESLQIQRDLRRPDLQATTLTALGEIHEHMGQKKKSLDLYQEAIQVREAMIGENPDLLREDGIESHHRLVRFLVEENEVAGAFKVMERARARAFLQEIGNRRVDPRAGSEPLLIQEEQKLRLRMQGLARQLRQSTPDGLAESGEPLDVRKALAKELDQTRQRYESLLLQLRQSHPEYSSLIRVDPLEVAEVQSLLKGSATLVEYFVQEKETLAWVIDERSVQLVRLDAAASDLQRLVAVLRGQLAGRENTDQTSATLYQKLIGQLRPHLRHDRLLLVPHGPLHNLPFAALRDPENGQYLVERFQLGYLPSASVLPFLLGKRNPNRGQALVLADPDLSLPGAAEEGRAVASLYGTKARLGPAATESSLRQLAATVDILHLSAHGVLDSARPLFSHMKLAADEQADGNLEVHEVLSLHLPEANLVVLSGCQTGLGEVRPGDDLVGLSRAFFYAGTPSLVVSQWAVDDKASAALMEGFHRRLRKGAPAAAALREAQIDLLKSTAWKSPYYWAAFLATGDVFDALQGVPNGAGPVAEGPAGGLP